jgi:branched-subunit amino acid transport protein
MNVDIGPLSLILLAAAATFLWRFLGVILSSRLRPEGAWIQWMTAVAYAVLAALAARMLVLPVGELATIPLSIRLAGAAVGIGVFFVTKRNALAGVVTGTLAFIALVAGH